MHPPALSRLRQIRALKKPYFFVPTLISFFSFASQKELIGLPPMFLRGSHKLCTEH